MKKAQEGVLEFLLINHPLDCPVCDKGGECPLQDQTLSHGPGESRFVEEKRHYAKPIPISDVVYLDRERCILCDRCTRFAKDVAGDPLISFTHRGNQTQILTFPDEPFASYFSGNTVQICPVGALTAKPYRFKARPWDLETVESTCTTCSVGCRITVESSRDQLAALPGRRRRRRQLGLDVRPRPLQLRGGQQRGPARRAARAQAGDDGDELVEVSWAEAIDAAAAAIRDAARRRRPRSVAVLGGARGTNEDAYAWAKLAKGVIGTDHVDAQLGDGLPAEAVFGLPPATIDEVCAATTVVLLGPDLKEELPVLYLRLRDAAERRAIRILELAERDTGLTPLRLAVAAPPARRAGGRGAGPRRQRSGGRARASTTTPSPRSASSSAPGAVAAVVGRANLASAGDFAVDAAAALLAAHPAGHASSPRCAAATCAAPSTWAWRPGCCPGAPCSTTPAASCGLRGRCCRPGPGSTPPASWRPPPPAASAASSCSAPIRWPTSPTATSPGGPSPAPARSSPSTPSSRSRRSQADVVLAVAAFGEKSGTTTNLEGRVSPLTPEGHRRRHGHGGLDDRRRAGRAPRRRPRARLGGRHRRRGRRVSAVHEARGTARRRRRRRSPVTSRCDSGADRRRRTTTTSASLVDRELYDAAVFTAQSPSLADLARGAAVSLNPWDADRRGFPEGTPVQVIAARTSVVLAGPARRPRAPRRRPPGVQPARRRVNELLDAALPVNDVRLEAGRAMTGCAARPRSRW